MYERIIVTDIDGQFQLFLGVHSRYSEFRNGNCFDSLDGQIEENRD